MPTDTFAPTSGDGYVSYQPTLGTTWATTRSAGSGDTANSTDVLYGPLIQASASVAGAYTLQRGFVSFDTSSLPDTAVISSAKIQLWCHAKDSSGGGSLCLVAATPASTTTLATSDYSLVGSTEFMTRIALSSITTGAYNDLTFNASGIAAISTTGVSSFGLRSSQDIDSSGPGAGATSYAFFYPGERTGTANDPVLSVTYTIPSGTVPLQPSRRTRGLYTR